jgi:hypothetical protein
MEDLKSAIISYLLFQSGILAGLMRKHTSLGKRIVAWFTGERPILLIGGEPGNGKSLLMGELVLRYNELLKLQLALQASLALISYDRVHYLFLKRLAELSVLDHLGFLPEGETRLEVRKLITQILQDTLLFAVQYLPPHTPIILEAPLIGHRGEDLIERLSAWGLGVHMQIFIMHSPTMWVEVLRHQQQATRETSAHALAMQQIHGALLQQRAIPMSSRQAENSALIKSWEQWLNGHEGIVITWNPFDDEAGFIHTRETLKAMNISPDPLVPETLQKYTSYLIDLVLELHPDLVAFANEVVRM